MTRWLTFSILRLVLLGVLSLLQFYFYRTLAAYLKVGKKRAQLLPLVRSLFILFTVPMLLLVVWRPPLSLAPSWFLDVFVYPFYIWHTASLVIGLILLIAMIVILPYKAIRWIQAKYRLGPQNGAGNQLSRNQTPAYDGRRNFLRHGLTIITGSVVAGTAFGAYRRNDHETIYQAIEIPQLPDAFNGITIGLISDIHSSPFMTIDQMRKYASAVNGLHTDLIVITGDFVNSELDEVYPLSEAFSELRAPLGVFGVLGNHDYFTRNVERVAQEIDSAGIRMLRNEAVILRKGEEKLALLGIDDTGNAGKASFAMESLVSRLPSHVRKILLCHRPYFLKEAQGQNIDLTLSGHTHGGQIVFARVGRDVIAPARIASPYVAGLYVMENSKMYVNRGLGTVGVPIRFNCPPEITVITLQNRNAK